MLKEPSPWHTDVTGSEAIRAVAWAHNAGIVTGASETVFGVGNSITRAQVAVILHRYLG